MNPKRVIAKVTGVGARIYSNTTPFQKTWQTAEPVPPVDWQNVANKAVLDG